MKRAPGYYWVFIKTMWIPADWTGWVWLIPGIPDSLNDSFFEQINETPLTPPDKMHLTPNT